MASNCEHCGAALAPGGVYCAACGRAASTDGDATAVMPAAATPNGAAPPGARPPGEQPRPWAGGALPGEAAPEIAKPDASGGGNQAWLIAVAVVLALLAAGAAALWLSRGDDYQRDLAEVLAPVSDSNREFNRVAYAAQDGGSTPALVDAAGEAAADARRALRDSESLAGGTNEQRAVVRRALEAEIAFALAVKRRNRWDAARLTELGEQAENTGARLAGIADGFEPLVLAPVLAVVDSFEQQAQEREQASDFVQDTEQVVADAQEAVAEWRALDASVASGNATVETARTDIEGVLRTRRSLLADASVISPPDEESNEVRGSLIEAFQATIDQAEDFQRQLGLYNESSGDEGQFLQEAWSRVYVAGSRSERKRDDFFDTYNDYRKRLGLATAPYDEL